MTAVTANANMPRTKSLGSSIASGNIQGGSHRLWLSATGAVMMAADGCAASKRRQKHLVPRSLAFTEGGALGAMRAFNVSAAPKPRDVADHPHPAGRHGRSGIAA